jgi:hypothetical protein
MHRSFSGTTTSGHMSFLVPCGDFAAENGLVLGALGIVFFFFWRVLQVFAAKFSANKKLWSAWRRM